MGGICPGGAGAARQPALAVLLRVMPGAAHPAGGAGRCWRRPGVMSCTKWCVLVMQQELPCRDTQTHHLDPAVVVC